MSKIIIVRSEAVSDQSAPSKMTITEVAERLGIKEQSIRQMVSNTRKGHGDFPLPDKSNGKLTWEKSEIEAYELKRSQTSTKSKSAAKQPDTNQETGSEPPAENDVSPISGEDAQVSAPSPKVGISAGTTKPVGNGRKRMLDLTAFQTSKATNKKVEEEPITNSRTVEARRPRPQEHIRSGEVLERPVRIIEYKPDGEFWLVLPHIAQNSRVAKEVSDAILHVAVNEFGVTFIWPIKTSRNSWDDSCREAAKDAVDTWVRVRGVFKKNMYFTYPAEDDLGEPVWSEFTLQELISYAFEDRVVEDLDSPILKKLWGMKSD